MVNKLDLFIFCVIVTFLLKMFFMKYIDKGFPSPSSSQTLSTSPPILPSFSLFRKQRKQNNNNKKNNRKKTQETHTDTNTKTKPIKAQNWKPQYAIKRSVRYKKKNTKQNNRREKVYKNSTEFVLCWLSPVRHLASS